jgi:hypothetical protein
VLAGRAELNLERNLTMVFGMSLATYTLLHVVISLIAIATGLVVVSGWLRSSRPGFWTASFLPSHWFGVISLVVLAIALLALYAFLLDGPWRWIYVTTALIALYLNVFVAVVQSFQKLAFLQPLAPTQSEGPFLIAQLAVLAVFVLLGVAAGRRYHPAAAA